MSELFRVLKGGGHCLVQTPFKDGNIYENESVKTDNERRAHFGQADHVRIYSVPGLVGRLENAGFKVSVENFDPKAGNRAGLLPETVLICQKR